MENVSFTKEDLLLDALLSEQFMTTLYNRAASSAVSLALRSEWVNILTEEHQMRYELLLEMQKRGWDAGQPAKSADAAALREKFPAL